jgi:UDP-glucose 4-epimerase
MSLHDAVDLVLFAFEYGNPGDLFVNKAPASTIKDLAEALQNLSGKKSVVKIIGTRHGEKVFETLCTREEMRKAEDMGNFYRIPADNRDLNYSSYFSDGDSETFEIQDYNSHNTRRLNVKEVEELLGKLGYVRKELFGEEVEDFIV